MDSVPKALWVPERRSCGKSWAQRDRSCGWQNCEQACLPSSLKHDIIHEKPEIVMCHGGVLLPTIKNSYLTFPL